MTPRAHDSRRMSREPRASRATPRYAGRVNFTALLMLVMLGCGSKQVEKEEAPPPEEESSRFGGLADRAKDLGAEAMAKAKDLAGEAKDEVVEKAVAVAAKAGEISSDAVTSGKELKSELRGKLALAKLDYDLTVDAVSEDEDAYQARLAGMKQLDVGDYKVGYARDAKHPLGEVYKWQIRVTWWVPGVRRAVRLSVFTDHDLPELELVTALVTIVPLAEKMILK
jgi:hypothetical protein